MALRETGIKTAHLPSVDRNPVSMVDRNTHANDGIRAIGSYNRMASLTPDFLQLGLSAQLLILNTS